MIKIHTCISFFLASKQKAPTIPLQTGDTHHLGSGKEPTSEQNFVYLTSQQIFTVSSLLDGYSLFFCPCQTITVEKTSGICNSPRGKAPALQIANSLHQLIYRQLLGSSQLLAFFLYPKFFERHVSFLFWFGLVFSSLRFHCYFVVADSSRSEHTYANFVTMNLLLSPSTQRRGRSLEGSQMNCTATVCSEG